MRIHKGLLRLVIILVAMMLLTSTASVGAQGGGTTCPQPTKCQLAQQGMALLQKYNVPVSLANGLLPYLSKGDLVGAGAYLMQAGVDQDTVNKLAQEVQPLIQQGLTSGAWQQLAVDNAVQSLPAEISPEERGKVLQMVGDPGLADFLTSRGLASDAIGGIVAKLEEAQEMGFDVGSLDEYVRIQGIAKALEAAGLSEDQRQALLDVYIDEGREGLQATLNEAGYDGKALSDQASEIIYSDYAAMGFTQEQATAFQSKAFLDNVQELAGDPEALAEYVQRRGFFGDDKQAENQAFVDAVTSGDAEAMRTALGQYPWLASSPDLVEKFLKGEEMDAPGLEAEDMEADPAFWDEYLAIEAVGASLRELGVPEEELADYMAALMEGEDVAELLAEEGYDVDSDTFWAGVDSAYEEALVDSGFDDESAAEFNEAVETVEGEEGEADEGDESEAAEDADDGDDSEAAEDADGGDAEDTNGGDDAGTTEEGGEGG